MCWQGWPEDNKHFYQMKIVENYDDHDEKNCDIVENYDETIDIDEKNIVILLMKTTMRTRPVDEPSSLRQVYDSAALESLTSPLRLPCIGYNINCSFIIFIIIPLY